MFKRKHKIEIVPESEYTDFSDRFAELDKYATKGTVAAASLIPVAVGAPLVFHRLTSTPELVTVTAPVIEPVNVLAQAPAITPTPMYSPEMVPVGFIADKSLETLANVLDPVIQILVAISFPIASVIMIGACFFFMFGNSEKAWSMIMNAGLGYVLIQLSPLFLDILREVGNAV